MMAEIFQHFFITGTFNFPFCVSDSGSAEFLPDIMCLHFYEKIHQHRIKNEGIS